MIWQRPKFKKTGDNDDYVDKLIEYNKKGDEQLDRIIKETQLSKETENFDNLIKLYEDILLKEGLCFNGKSYYINLAELYFKIGQTDKAWGYLNKIGIKHPDLMGKIRELQVKILKKEKKYTHALLFQLGELFYEINKDYRPSEEKINSKLCGLVKKCKLENKYDSIKSLIFSSANEIDLRNNFEGLLSKGAGSNE
jgi:tetratricopeptide (TPR) repeat protein